MLTKHDTWLDPQLPLADEPNIRVSRNVDATGVSVVASRFGLDEGSFGVQVRPAFNSTTTETHSHAVAPTDRGSQLFVPVVSPAPPMHVASEAELDTRLPAITPLRSNDYAELDEPIPNEAPQAFDDEVTVTEDSSVVFDPTLNDTDPDEEDVLWVKEVQSETDHGRTFWEEGGLIRYIPNPNYENTSGYPWYGDDTVTYTVTDGVDESTATVYVTVSAVNDVPVAANDAGIFINTMYDYPYGDPESIFQYQPSYNPYLVVNDRDYDGGSTPLTVQSGDVDLTHVKPDQSTEATKGIVSVLTNGSYTWGGPKGWTGETSFKYRSTDGQGAKSEWVTVKLIASQSSEGYGSVSANADIVAIGDGPDTGNVLTNDSGSFVVLNSQPSSGRLTKFGFEGDLTFLSDYTRSEPTFSYTVFNTNGRVRATAEVQTTAVNLTAWHGQYKAASGGQAESKPVGELNEGWGYLGNLLIPVVKASGAFTVANLNDSDADGLIDSDPNDKDGQEAKNAQGAAIYPGSGEVDLIRVVMQKPAAMGQKTVTLRISPESNPRLWKEQRKGGEGKEIALTNGMATFTDATFPTDALWIELRAPSTTVRGVSIEMKFDNKLMDSVAATAMWTQHNPNEPHGWPNGYFTNAGAVLPADADSKELRAIFDLIGTFGIEDRVAKQIDGFNAFRFGATQLSKFTIQPSGLTPYSILGLVSIDVTRSLQKFNYFDNDSNRLNNSKQNDKPLPTWVDVSNDEFQFAKDSDNDTDLAAVTSGAITSTDNVYSIDSPALFGYLETPVGITLHAPGNPQFYELNYRANFFDFVRIRIGSSFTAGNDLLQGSRSSVFYRWFAMRHLIRKPAPPPPIGGVWSIEQIRAAAPVVTENRIDKGYIDITVAGGGVTS